MTYLTNVSDLFPLLLSRVYTGGIMCARMKKNDRAWFGILEDRKLPSVNKSRQRQIHIVLLFYLERLKHSINFQSLRMRIPIRIFYYIYSNTFEDQLVIDYSDN